MIIARDSRFAAVVIHSKIRVEIKHKAQGKTQNGIASMLLLRDGGTEDEGRHRQFGLLSPFKSAAEIERGPAPTA
jgi:hypothetical protein